MIEFDAFYYDGRTSARVPVRVWASQGVLQLEGEGILLEVPLEAASPDDPIPGVRRVITLPGGAQLSTDAHAEVERVFAAVKRSGWVYALERRWRYAVAALAVVAGAVAWGIFYGLPLGAELAARLVPPELEARLGEQTLSSIDSAFCEPTKLSAQRQQALQEGFRRLIAGRDDASRYRLELRACKIGPNAFALPGGTVVMTDELVALAQNDAQIVSVLAHELGHVRGRHALRQALQAAGAAALISAVAGDAVSITSLAATLPAILLQTGYSRGFEEDADSYAFQRLKEIGISPAAFAEILTRLEDRRQGDPDRAGGNSRKADAERSRDYLSTHPASARRIERALESAKSN